MGGGEGVGRGGGIGGCGGALLVRVCGRSGKKAHAVVPRFAEGKFIMR